MIKLEVFASCLDLTRQVGPVLVHKITSVLQAAQVRTLRTLANRVVDCTSADAHSDGTGQILTASRVRE